MPEPELSDEGEVSLGKGETRRRMMVDLIPYIVSVYLRAKSAISPASLLSKALESSGNVSSGRPSRREELTAALRGVEELNLRQEGSAFGRVKPSTS